MWEQEISHHDCCLNVGLLDEQYISCSCAREMELRIQYLFHVTHVQAKKRKTPTFFFHMKISFFPSFYAVQHIKLFLIWRNPHPVARIHEGSCVQCQPHSYVLFGRINGSELICHCASLLHPQFILRKVYRFFQTLIWLAREILGVHKMNN